MTIAERMTELATENGLFPDQAEAVLAELKKAKGTEGMEWNDEADAYPKAMLAVLWLRYKTEAVKWIDTNMPLHWARPMFVDRQKEE